MVRGSNAVVGGINFLTFLVSIPILGAGIWLSTKATTDCLKFLQWPIIIIGVALMIISLAGFAGACCYMSWLLQFYLFAMFIVIAVLIGFTIFAFVVTNQGEGKQVPGRTFLEYQLSDYSDWLRERVSNSGTGGRSDPACRKRRSAGRSAATSSSPAARLRRRRPSSSTLVTSPPSRRCGIPAAARWRWPRRTSTAGGGATHQEELCYDCDSCRAGVVAMLKRSWRRVVLINIVVIVFLVILYVLACVAVRNNRRYDSGVGFGVARMTKSHPSRFQF
ncbi:unnamed protein product [Spirodela intermedia]|uniref:Uncharacterized protein n=1 Tax=Spirodela intermedia TaxID=51605 RepID=A0A7I8JHV8_SPIIN|nr:unnamed protein product [Spirodela intermedia]CAA6669325.1 unnamed protein product [Spirodela intermedia]